MKADKIIFVYSGKDCMDFFCFFTENSRFFTGIAVKQGWLKQLFPDLCFDFSYIQTQRMPVHLAIKNWFKRVHCKFIHDMLPWFMTKEKREHQPCTSITQQELTYVLLIQSISTTQCYTPKNRNNSKKKHLMAVHYNCDSFAWAIFSRFSPKKVMNLSALWNYFLNSNGKVEKKTLKT